MAEPESTELAVVEPQAHLAPWTPRFALTVDQAVALVEQKREFMKRVMRENEHFGTIPGTPKPTLFKPGAELLLSAMGLHSDSSINTVPPIIDLLGKEHGGEAFVMFQKTCEIYREEIAGERILIARASANCSTWEKKYRYRKAERTCPKCGKVGTIIKGKAEYGGGWLCWKSKGGCSAKFGDADKTITEQATADVPNPDIADLINTVEKIAAKRALVAATLLATGCSDIFTQDLEDGGNGDDERHERPPVVDQNGEIPSTKASPESVSALRQAEAVAKVAATAPANPAAGPQSASAQVNSGGAVAGATMAAPPPSGPRAKRGHVIPAPQGAPSSDQRTGQPGQGEDSPPAPAAIQGPPPAVAVTSAPPLGLVDPQDEEDGREAYLHSLRQQAREAAAVLRQLRVRSENQKNKEAIALGTLAALAIPPATPSPDSDASLAAYIGDIHPGQTLATLAEAELKAVVDKLEELTARVSAKLR